MTRVTKMEAALTEMLVAVGKLRADLTERVQKRRVRTRQLYYQDHEGVKQKRREYYKARAPHLRERVPCPRCGTCVSRQGMRKHQTTAKCRRIAEARAEEAESKAAVSPAL